MKKKTNDDLMFLNNHDDQYHEILDNIEAVSYTHLDVYKRQVTW